ncbi:unnamed protein product [Gongylonema pulchrum]|uniref:Uncharacterized protein n=1 Tax=Gongylonema pulchrum TaxID=637853 RepID=A0A183CVX8_9BILA|nr:unnamed protein product [Gongylonema pulchrum]
MEEQLRQCPPILFMLPSLCSPLQPFDNRTHCNPFVYFRLIFYEYTFWSQTRVYEEKTLLNEAIIETINATYAFDILHHDPEGKILARYRVNFRFRFRIKN